MIARGNVWSGKPLPKWKRFGTAAEGNQTVWATPATAANMANWFVPADLPTAGQSVLWWQTNCTSALRQLRPTGVKHGS